MSTATYQPRNAASVRLPKTAKKFLVSLTTAAFSLSAAFVSTVATTTPVAAAPTPLIPAATTSGQQPVCAPGTDGQWPNMGNLPLFTDNNVAMYVGGDALFNNGESEGLIVVEGDLSIDRDPSGLYNLGYVGVGSQILPGHEELMLSVGGNFSATSNTTSLQIGMSPSPVGTYMVGGTDTTESIVDVGTKIPFDQTGTPADGFAAKVTGGSQAIAAMTATGTTNVLSEPWGTTITLQGDGTSNPQVFEVPGSALAMTNLALDVTNIPADAAIMLNVTGAAPVNIHHSLTYSLNGNTIQWDTADSGYFASHLLWNFTETKEVNITPDKNAYDAQILGTILAANGSDVVVNSWSSLNGRVYTTGDLNLHGAGREFHNYSFVGWPDFDCIVDPVDPTDPTDPVDPTDPTDPVDPTDPTTDPVDPTDPTTDPVDPTDPTTDPVDPTDPTTDPVDPTDPTTDPVDPTDPTTDPVDPTDPTGGTDEGTLDSDEESGTSSGTLDESLAQTGAQVAGLIAIATVLVGIGAAIVVGVRRRKA
ncbi:choice-of-anchor A family protein [Timonella sp. A28]|uniref:choice-of-anchor A family protein n=1 Tax=Timonella sp. A28 TaxID=3442640 RepID=UPI003EBAD2E7